MMKKKNTSAPLNPRPNAVARNRSAAALTTLFVGGAKTSVPRKPRRER